MSIRTRIGFLVFVPVLGTAVFFAQQHNQPTSAPASRIDLDVVVTPKSGPAVGRWSSGSENSKLTGERQATRIDIGGPFNQGFPVGPECYQHSRPRFHLGRGHSPLDIYSLSKIIY